VNVVDVVREIVYYTLLVFWLLLVARVLTELAHLVARSWDPTGWAAAGLEVVYTATDPPVRLLRKVIPTVRVGRVGLDLSVTVLLLALAIAMPIAKP